MNRGGQQIQMSVPPFTFAVKWIIISSVSIWFLCQVLLENVIKIPFTQFFNLVPSQVLFEFKIWQPYTYMFLHSTREISHILFNLLMLWFLGADLEQKWGSRSFFLFYIMNGAGAALIYVFSIALYSAIFGSQVALIIPVVGASGALFAIMVAYAWHFGDRMMYFFMLFPIKAKYFVMILGFIQVASMLTSGISGGEVAYLAHLGGLVSGFLAVWGKDRWDRYNLNRKNKKKGRNLRLVVDNEKKESKDPRYWN